MLLRKNKFKKRLRGLVGIALASFLIISALCISAFAEMSDIISDMLPDGTNVPDTDIGGATGMDGTTPLGTLPQSLPDKDSGSVPQAKANSDQSMAEDSNTLERTLGIVIAVIVVLSVIVLIIALVPKRERYESDKRKK